ncbi:MAG: hypothetical protein FJ298_00665 [Planctomycetes bacterium]|nr:hypothetical protein [Planctomycetota bacterium]
MVRSTLIVAAAALVCGSSFAQQVDNVYPIPGAIQQGPVINLRTGQPVSTARESQIRAVTNYIYDNTCTWTGGGFYTGTGYCETYIDEGRIPGGVGGTAPTGATVDNDVTYFEVGYCTKAALGTVDIKVGFFDSLGGQCGGFPPAPMPPALSTQGTVFQLPIATMPGGSTTGALQCWIVGFDLGNTGFCMQSDADGIYDNNADLDRFNWSWQMDNVLTGSGDQGILLSGEPFATVPGACTYNIPCAVNPIGGANCGSGLANDDAFWINVDNDIAGGGLTPGTSCPSAPSGGTGCYWFGGAPGNPFAGFWMVLGNNGSCGGCAAQAVNYCTAGTTTSGCNATMTLASGIPSASNAGAAILSATNVEGAKTGLLFYGVARNVSAWSPTSSSFLCVKSPTLRSGTQSTGGTAGACDGSMSLDINAALAAQTAFPVAAGGVFDIQAWFRDPPAPKTTHLSDGLEITLCP